MKTYPGPWPDLRRMMKRARERTNHYILYEMGRATGFAVDQLLAAILKGEA